KNLLISGAPIQEINTVRKKFSLIKGGGLAKILYPRTVYQFLLNDVVGKHTERFVSSGIMYPEKISLSLIKKIFKKYNIPLNFSLDGLRFPKKNQSSLKKTFVIGNNQIACEKTKLVLEKYNFTTKILKTNFAGTIQEYESLILKSIQRHLKKLKPKMAYIWGGEPTVRVTGRGKGGRNQELALRMAIQFYKNEEFQRFSKGFLTFVSFGTDGRDGPTDAAGAIVTKNTYSEIFKAGQFRTPEEFLIHNDSYNALTLSNSLIKTEYTGTNLNDIAILFLV
ncbi:MAG: MOFRL family protein, partial [Leptonema sp. (in: bacteria)]